MALGYFKENPYHNVVHILDSLQGLHYMLKIGNMKKFLKRQDNLAVFIACLVHDVRVFVRVCVCVVLV